MASDKITQKDVIDKSVNKEFEDLNKTLTQSVKLVSDLTKAAIDMFKAFDPNDIQAVANAQKEYNDLVNKSQSENKKASDTLEKLRQKIKDVNEEEERAKIALQEKRKAIKDKIKAEKESAKTTEKLTKVLQQNAKTEKQATEQNKKLIAMRKELDITTTKGAKSVSAINKVIDRNNELLKSNASTLGKQKMNVGAYKDGIKEALAEQEFFGVSLNKISSAFKSGAGIVGAVTAAVVGLGKAYASSARGAEDMARASDRLNSIAKSLGNSLADAAGDTNLFDNIVRAFQEKMFGLASTMESDVQVGILSTIRNLQALELEQEAQKKTQLNRAEKQRQIRDDERKSFEERKAANDELGKIINEREEETIAFQKQKLLGYQALLAFDKENIEIQQAIKQIEFEIADAEEEAQGFRSEQQMNDLALSREYLQNKLELQQEIIQGEINANAESFNLKKKLIDTTLQLELEAAGENQQLRDIATQKAINAEQQLTAAIFTEHDKRNERLAIETENLIAKREEDVEREIEWFDEDLEREIEQQAAMTDVEIEEINKRTEAQLAADEAKKESFKQWAQFATQQAQQLSGSIFGYIQSELDYQLQADIEKAKSRGASEAEMEKIEKDHAKKRKDLRLTQAIINTALGVTNALATASSWIEGIIAAVLVGAMGALEIATIESQSFYKGTKDSGSKWLDATVGEIGTERINFADGTSMYTPPTATKMLLPPHSEVVPNIELQRELAELQQVNQTKQLREDQKQDFKELIKAVKNKQELTLNITENGIGVTAKKGNNFYKYIDRRYRGR